MKKSSSGMASVSQTLLALREIPKDWKDHGKNVEGAGETWMALVSPSIGRRGEWGRHSALRTAQAAATLIEWMGGDWKEFDPSAAPPIP